MGTIIPVLGWAGVGNSSGSGADRVELEKKSAWFLNKAGHPSRAVRYCVIKSDDFGYEKEKALSDIRQAFDLWKNYLISKHVNYPGLNEPLNSDFQYVETCTLATDLTFYLGVIDSRIKPIHSNYETPVAFTYKEQYDYGTHWSRGFIWIASNQSYLDPDHQGNKQYPYWNAPSRFLSIVLHEVGHIFGNGHVNGTIMREDIWKFSTLDEVFVSSERFEPSFRLKIDHQKELLLRLTADMYDTSPYILTYSYDSSFSKLFKRLTGKELVGKFSVDLDFRSMYLTVRDELRETRLCLIKHSDHSQNEISKTFMRSWTIGNFSYMPHTMGIHYGLISNCQSGSIDVGAFIEYNMGNYPVTLSSFESFFIEPLLHFDSKY